MKIENKIEFTSIKNEKEFKFLIDHGAPLGDAYQAAVEVVQEIARMINVYVDKLPVEKQEVEEEKPQG